jgi:hypothetical protein
MFSDTEKEYLRKLIGKELENFKADEKETSMTDVTPAFLKGEKEYEEFLQGLLEKLK